METKETGYQIPSYPMQTKRYCQMLDLKNDPQLIAEYKKRHSPEYYWKEIGEGIRAVGIDFEWKTAFQKLATLPRQEEWERYMSVFQDVDADASSDEKWQLMEQMFSLTKAME